MTKKIFDKFFNGIVIRRFGVLIAMVPFLAGLVLLFFEDTDLINPGSSFGGPGWASPLIYLFGVLICLGSIPFLYVSAYTDLKNSSKIWILKLILIYPLFLVGFFFQYGSDCCFLLITIPLSLLVIFAVHLNLLFLSFGRIFQRKKGMFYFFNLICLAAYYITLIILQFSMNLLYVMKNELYVIAKALHLG